MEELLAEASKGVNGERCLPDTHIWKSGKKRHQQRVPVSHQQGKREARRPGGRGTDQPVACLMSHRRCKLGLDWGLTVGFSMWSSWQS